jgi:hypothetical protein
MYVDITAGLGDTTDKNEVLRFAQDDSLLEMTVFGERNFLNDIECSG